ncbi:hypothetical protein [Aureimonas sp. AU40]|uniref:DUF7940 domain-containing protein n=1 Tax=Aureimonas sp. AU40 TaxID=1637747 RepID=UPI0007847CF8|nr:hypothetical protein [Aureimonas sp. AU40]
MRFVEDWKSILRKAWSIRFMGAAFLLSVAEYALPFFTDVIPDHLLGLLGGAAAGGAFVARLVAQANLSNGGKQQ